MKRAVAVVLILAVLLIPFRPAHAGAIFKSALIGVSVGLVAGVAMHYAHKDMTTKQEVLASAGIAALVGSSIYMAIVDTNPSLINIGAKGKTLQMPRIKRTFTKDGSRYRVGLTSVRF